MPRTIQEIERDLAAAKDEQLVIRRRISRLEDELIGAKVAEKENDPHPWLGKKVRRVTPRSSWKRGAGDKVLRGTLMIYGKDGYYRGGDPVYRGDLIVVSRSGLTAYRFNTLPNEQPWELDE